MFPKIFFRIIKVRRVKRRVVRRRRKIHHFSNSEYLKYKEGARKFVHSRLDHFNQFYCYKYNKIAIRNQSSRWGSCSRKGNLNFNYRIALLPPELADYIIVHELCHLKEFNHSKNFWNLVEQTIPDWKILKRKLRGQAELFKNIK